MTDTAPLTEPELKREEAHSGPDVHIGKGARIGPSIV